jgi:cell pole-organizing protein PopZ
MGRAALTIENSNLIEEVLREMLRPMVQDWLHNNLPILVERLVREEIELASRAGARPRPAAASRRKPG